MMTEAKYYINAYGQFQDRYHAIPGDMANATDQWSTTANGDGNGEIGIDETGHTNARERYLAWQQLSLAGFISGSYTGTGRNGNTGNDPIHGGVVTYDWGISEAIPNENSPRGNITGVTYMFDHPQATDGNVVGENYYFDGTYSNVLRSIDVTNAGESFLTAQEALEMDRKFDDGNPVTGWIVTTKNTKCVLGFDPASALYDRTQTGKACNFVFKIQ